MAAELDCSDGRFADNGRLLFEAATKNDVAELRRLLYERVGPDDYKTEHGTTALIAAASAGHVEAVSELLQGGADAQLANSFKETAIDLARLNKWPKVVAVLPGGTHDFNSINTKREPCRQCERVVGAGRAGLFCKNCTICKECGLRFVCGKGGGGSPAGTHRRPSLGGGGRRPSLPNAIPGRRPSLTGGGSFRRPSIGISDGPDMQSFAGVGDSSSGGSPSVNPAKPTLAGKVKEKAKVVRAHSLTSMRSTERRPSVTVTYDSPEVLAAREATRREEKEATTRKKTEQLRRGKLSRIAHAIKRAGSKKSMSGGGGPPSAVDDDDDDGPGRATTTRKGSGPSIHDDGVRAAGAAEAAAYRRSSLCSASSSDEEGGGPTMADAAAAAANTTPGQGRRSSSSSASSSDEEGRPTMAEAAAAAAAERGIGAGVSDSQASASAAVPGVSRPVLLTTEAAGPSSLGSSPSPGRPNSALARARASNSAKGLRAGDMSKSPSPLSVAKGAVRRTLSFEKKKKERGQRFVDEE